MLQDMTNFFLTIRIPIHIRIRLTVKPFSSSFCIQFLYVEASIGYRYFVVTCDPYITDINIHALFITIFDKVTRKLKSTFKCKKMENLYLVCLPILFFSANAQYSLLTSAPFATRDQEFILTCSISNSETSAATTWSRNSVSVVNIRISKCFEGDTGQGLFNLYRYNCTTSSRRYNLIIPTPRINNEADSRWYCGPSGGGSYSNFYTLQFYTQHSLLTSEPYATRDKEFMLTCNIGTNSGIVFGWTRNDVAVVSVRISDCFTADAGQVN
ncbi:hypothetical protein KUTeg_006289 [Tegillarca granosa]|uniref:Ig-like domain-containing protein n=1 Tax=Tegillarca granosa TaxID=220873 RepID=A0ABQ9FKR8_TEGGR|nr:hypothetical protein KUTeg_006289 [Tegillarca granosa]